MSARERTRWQTGEGSGGGEWRRETSWIILAGLQLRLEDERREKIHENKNTQVCTRKHIWLFTAQSGVMGTMDGSASPPIY